MVSTNAVEAIEVQLCPSCTSSRQKELTGEICLHFPGGLGSLHKPLIWVFRKVVVCLDCGVAQFAVPVAELKLIQDNLQMSA